MLMWSEVGYSPADRKRLSRDDKRLKARCSNTEPSTTGTLVVARDSHEHTSRSKFSAVPLAGTWRRFDKSSVRVDRPSSSVVDASGRRDIAPLIAAWKVGDEAFGRLGGDTSRASKAGSITAIGIVPTASGVVSA